MALSKFLKGIRSLRADIPCWGRYRARILL